MQIMRVFHAIKRILELERSKKQHNLRKPIEVSERQGAPGELKNVGYKPIAYGSSGTDGTRLRTTHSTSCTMRGTVGRRLRANC